MFNVIRLNLTYTPKIVYLNLIFFVQFWLAVIQLNLIFFVQFWLPIMISPMEIIKETTTFITYLLQINMIVNNIRAKILVQRDKIKIKINLNIINQY